MSYQDTITQGTEIGFFPDNALAVGVNGAAADLQAPPEMTFNNITAGAFPVVAGAFNAFDSWNSGLLRRTQAWNFDPAGVSGSSAKTWSSLLPVQSLNQLWKSYIFTKVNSGVGIAGVWQCAITAIIKLKHLHSFFERVPLLKGVFMRMTLNLNQSSVSFTCDADGDYTAVSVSSPLGGVSPLMLAGAGGNGAFTGAGGDFIYSIAVGRNVLNSTQRNIAGVSSAPLSGSIILNVPAYTFNPVFETSYLANAVKKVVYSDIYQYQVVNAIGALGAGGATFNNLITNGIANIKSVLVLPFYQAAANGGIAPIQSPFEGSGGGTTSPLCLLSQFNIQISGQNAIYNTQRYNYEQFCNQLYGVNKVNGGLTDGLTSGMVGLTDFEMAYNYYYVDCGRMLPVEEAVPKSVNLLGTNQSAKALDLFVFVEYGVEVSIDILTGARV
jgi:hypothetical protein